MDLPNGERGPGDEGIQNSQKGKNKFHRHSTQQIQHLEILYKGCPHPDKNQRQQFGRELGLDPVQIKSWFQKKRNQIKAQNERADSNSLRIENEKIRTENLAMQAAQKTILCCSCAGSCRGGNEHNTFLQLRTENMRLKKEHEQAMIAFSDYMENLASASPETEPLTIIPADHFPGEGMGLTTQVPPLSEIPVAQHLLGGILERDKSKLLELDDEVIETLEEQRNIMKLSHRMVMNFCEELTMLDKGDFPHGMGFENGGVRVSIRNSTKAGQLEGFVMSVASSIWLPIRKENLFEFLNDEKKRDKWDVLSGGNPVCAIARVSSGEHPGNCISLIQTLVPGEPKLSMLQESRINSLGALIVYAPIDLQTIVSVAHGEDSTKTQILPSGFIISGDGNTVCGSLLKVAYQILMCRGQLTEEKKMESMATVHAMICSTIQKIKSALGVSD